MFKTIGLVCSSIGNRLGNQMCNIAAGLSFAKKYNKEFVITTPYKHNLNNSSYTEYKWILDKFKKIPIEETVGFKEVKEGYKQDIIDVDKYSNEDNLIFIGIFNSDKYYDDEYVRKVFGNNDEDKERIYKKYGNLKNFVSLSIRRGDYLHFGNTFISPSKEWYEKCYCKYFEGYDLLVTSDDINWASNNITFGCGKTIYLDEPDAIKTLKIKQCCKNHIIPPSTYSWWSAYLSGDDSTVIVPDMWFTEKSGIDSENKFRKQWIREKLI